MPGRRISLGDFAGDWNLKRRIDDRLAGAQSRFSGSATFTPEPSGLAYLERGSLTLPTGTVLAAERRYLWTETADGFAVAFADGRPFHSFAPFSPDAAHWCDPDTYRVNYDFGRWPEWTATWDVTGPRKDYRVVSDYSPTPLLR